MVLEKTLESSLECKEIRHLAIQTLLKEINPEYSLEGLLLKLELQSFGRLMCKASSLEKQLILGNVESKEKVVAEDVLVR